MAGCMAGYKAGYQAGYKAGYKAGSVAHLREASLERGVGGIPQYAPCSPQLEHSWLRSARPGPSLRLGRGTLLTHCALASLVCSLSASVISWSAAFAAASVNLLGAGLIGMWGVRV